MNISSLFRQLLAGLVLGVTALQVGAQIWPAKPITMIVPWPAGGPSDFVARKLQSEMAKALGQPVVIDNIGGAGGAIGIQKNVGAAADGYTMSLASPLELIVAPLTLAAVKYKPEDLKIVGQIVKAPLVLLALLAVVAGWTFPGGFGVANLLEQARPAGTAAATTGGFLFGGITIPSEHESHVGAIHVTATLTAFGTAAVGVLLAAVMYLWRLISPTVVAYLFRPVYRFLAGRWYFDELYHAVFVLPVLGLASLASGTDRSVIDRIIDGIAWTARQLAGFDAWIDRTLVDGLVNATAHATWNAGLTLKQLQTGHLRQYVMFIVIGTVALFVLASILFRSSLAG